MSPSELDRLEFAIGQLTFTQQVWLMDRLAQKIRDRSARVMSVEDKQLEAMARDPAIQRELLEIENEDAVRYCLGL
jgi:hypothetical protein